MIGRTSCKINVVTRPLTEPRGRCCGKGHVFSLLVLLSAAVEAVALQYCMFFNVLYSKTYGTRYKTTWYLRYQVLVQLSDFTVSRVGKFEISIR